MADQGKDATAADDVPRQRRTGKHHPEITPRQLAGKHQVRDFRRTDHDVGEVAQRHQISDEDDDPHLRALHGRDHPDHGGDHPTGDDALGEHLAGVVLHDLAADFKEGVIGPGVKDRQLEHHVGHEYRPAQIAEQDDAPQADQPAKIGQGRFGHHREDGGQGVFGEQLLAGENHREETGTVAETGDDLEFVTLGQARIEQAHAHQRQAHGQSGRERRPPQRGDAALQFLIALRADDFMQNRCARRLVFLDFVLFIGREVGGLAVCRGGHGVGTGWGLLATTVLAWNTFCMRHANPRFYA